MKDILAFSILILFSLNITAQCEAPDFPDDLESLPDRLMAKYAGEFPNLTFLNGDGESFDIRSLRGEAIVINYWAFSCAPCIEEMPDLNKLVKKYGESTRFISLIAPGKVQIENESLQKKLSSFDFDYDHLATIECLYDNFEIPFIYPAHIIINKNGALVDVFFGADIKRLEKGIKASL